MENFDFRNPTKIIFGRGAENRVGTETAAYAKKILLHFGGKSIKNSGLYDRVTASLKSAGVQWVELGGVVPNPRLSLVRQGIKLCKEHKLELILAVGGGSVIDSAKAIAMGQIKPLSKTFNHQLATMHLNTYLLCKIIENPNIVIAGEEVHRNAAIGELCNFAQ